MPAWISIYCSQPIDGIKPEQIPLGIKNNDYWTLAEDYDIEDDQVTPALDQLQVLSTTDGFELRYRPEDERPLFIRCWTSNARVEEEIDEADEWCDDLDSNTATNVRKRLPQVQAVIGIEMGFSQLEDMGVVFAYEVARWFGQNYGGLIRGDDGHWSLIEDGGFVHL